MSNFCQSDTEDFTSSIHIQIILISQQSFYEGKYAALAWVRNKNSFTRKNNAFKRT